MSEAPPRHTTLCTGGFLALRIIKEQAERSGGHVHRQVRAVFGMAFLSSPLPSVTHSRVQETKGQGLDKRHHKGEGGLTLILVPAARGSVRAISEEDHVLPASENIKTTSKY